jgi:TatD DNase family protein
VIDSHCHLADEAFEADLDEVVARAREAGVSEALMILAAGDVAEGNRAARVRTAWPAVRVATGIHPHSAGPHGEDVTAAAALVRKAVEGRRAVAIGEIGLDYHYDFAPPRAQQDVFAAQVALAVETDLPVIVHTREATDDTFAILREAGGGRVRGVFHCFTGDAAMARRALDIGFHLSFAGIVTFPKAQSLRDAAAIVPPDRLLIETDSPYLAPVPHRGKRNEPAFVGRVLDTLAGVVRMDRAALEAAIDANFAALFGPNLSARTA